MSSFFKVAAAVGMTMAAVGLRAWPVHATTVANLSNRGEAGYELSPAPASASASTTFSVPALRCPATGLLGIAPGAFVFTGSGSTASMSGASVFMVCQNGGTFYQAEAIVNGTTTALPVSVAKRDSVKTAVSVSATKVSVTFTDTTRHLTYTLTGSGAVPAQILDGIDALRNGTTGARLGVPKFGSMGFSHGAIDGKTLKAVAAKAVDRASATHQVQIKTGPLDVTGTKFTETYRHS